MSEPRKELLMHVDGMTSAGCADAVTQAIRHLDPGAEVSVDLDNGRVAIATCAQALEVAQALGKAGYDARAMTL